MIPFEEKLKEINLMYLLKECPDPFLIIDKDVFIFCNEATLKIFNCSMDYILNKHPWEISPGFQEDSCSSKEKAQSILYSDFDDVKFEWFHLKENGEIFPVEVHLWKLNDLIFCFWRDISNRKNKEKEIQKQRALLKSTIDGMALPAFTINNDSVITNWNKACEILTGLKSSEMIGTCRQWEPFYEFPRPCLADLLVKKAAEEDFSMWYKNWKKSDVLSGAYEAEGFFKTLSKHLFFTASPLLDNEHNVIGAIETFQDISFLKEKILLLEESVKEKTEIAYLDVLTNLANNRKMRIFLNDLLKTNEKFCLAIFDADDFKKINDTYGHLIGDIALSYIGSEIKNHLRENDVGFRYGGEEFVVVVHSKAKNAVKVLERLKFEISSKPYHKDYDLFVNVSVGFTERKIHDTIDSIFNRADSALYYSKNNGKNMISFNDKDD